MPVPLPPIASSPQRMLDPFDSQYLSRLERLHLLAKKLFRGEHRAERLSRQSGSSLEFADYRNYALGDDPRSIDWNIYARLDRLFIKLFEHEQDLQVHLLIDASESMRWQAPGAGEAGLSKLDQARRIAASLAYIALANLDRVAIHWFSDRLRSDAGLLRGKAQFHRVLDLLRQPPEERGPTRLLAAARQFTQRTTQRCLLLVLSDFFDPDGFEEALSLLRSKRSDLNVIQVLDPQELEPAQSGDLRLRDAETGELLEVTVNDSVLKDYRRTVGAYLERLDRFCRERGVAHVRATTAVPFDELVLNVLRDGVMLR